MSGVAILIREIIAGRLLRLALWLAPDFCLRWARFVASSAAEAVARSLNEQKPPAP